MTQVSSDLLRAALLGAVITAAIGVAEAASVSDIATYAGVDRQAMLEAGARKEGKIIAYITPAEFKSILGRFQEKYPYVQLEAARGDTPEMTRRAIEENRAGRNIADIIVLNLGGLGVAQNAGLLEPFKTPEEKFYEAGTKGPKGYWITAYEAYVGLGYNTKLVSSAEAPKTYDDLLDPKWKGKMALSGTGSTLPAWAGVIVLSKGEDFLRKLGKQDVTMYSVGGQALSGFVVSGEVALSPMIYNSHMANAKNSGATVGWNALGATYSGASGAGLLRAAPHPHAAMLFLDFLFSREGQILRQEVGDSSPRTDLATPDKPSEVLYLTDRPNFLTESEQWTKLAKEIFGPGKEKK
jgi:iron(III) transport system substrate-binding protein